MPRNKPYKRSWDHFRENLPADRRRRSPGNRTLTVQPQFPLEDIYISLFTEQRVYDRDGNYTYEPIPNRLAPTHVELLDALRAELSKETANLKSFGSRYGLTPPDLNGFVLALTGMEATTFRLAWQMRRVDELLRYTDLSIEEVARRSGVGTTSNLFYACHRDFYCSPTERRNAIREWNALDRFR